ncbi:MAG: cell division protein ZapA [Proteobacteria bacterium]|nr:cell division protein ZapA [Pseudomonadota bacterium]
MSAFTREFVIMGHKVVIRDPAEAELANLALNQVNATLDRIQVQQPGLTPQQVTTLALLEIAGTLIKDRQAIDRYRSELDRRCTDLMGEISALSRRSAEPPVW